MADDSDTAHSADSGEAAPAASSAAEFVAAGAAAVAPLLRLHEDVERAARVRRDERAVELSERLLAAAEALTPEPNKSLIVAWALDDLFERRVQTRFDSNSMGALAPTRDGFDDSKQRMRSLYADEASGLLALKRRALLIFFRRWRAGTLFALSAEELAVYGPPVDLNDCAVSARSLLPVVTRTFAHWQTLKILASRVINAIMLWPASRSSAEALNRARLVHGALCATLELDASVAFAGGLTRVLPIGHGLAAALLALLTLAMTDSELLIVMRRECGLTAAQESTLSVMMHTLDERCRDYGSHRYLAPLRAIWDERAQRGAEDVARHGLRCCALPACDAVEAHPKHFKACGRCRGVVYCSPAHQREDWKRHKRDDGCTEATHAAAAAETE